MEELYEQVSKSLENMLEKAKGFTKSIKEHQDLMMGVDESVINDLPEEKMKKLTDLLENYQNTLKDAGLN